MSLWHRISAFFGSGLTDHAAVRMDASFRALIGITPAHNKIHAGDSFISDAVDTAMGNTDTLILAFKTPNTTKWGHLTVEFVSKASAHLEIIEGPTWDASSGALSPIVNRNRNSVNTSGMLEDQSTGLFIANSNLILNPTTFAGGTVIHHLYTWADKKFGGARADSHEFELDQNQTYGIRVTADEGTNAAQIILSWYEHVDLS